MKETIDININNCLGFSKLVLTEIRKKIKQKVTKLCFKNKWGLSETEVEVNIIAHITVTKKSNEKDKEIDWTEIL